MHEGRSTTSPESDQVSGGSCSRRPARVGIARRSVRPSCPFHGRLCATMTRREPRAASRTGKPAAMDESVTAPTLWGLVEARAAATPDAVMLIDERDRTMTFAEFRDACERAAAGFHDQGVRPGDTVSWQVPTWIETLVLMAALSRLGVRQVPLLPIYRERELTFCLRQADAKTLYVPGTWRGFDYVALAERVRERIGHFDIVVLDR